MSAYRGFPNGPLVCLYDMVLIFLMFLLQSHIHIYYLVCEVRKRMLDC